MTDRPGGRFDKFEWTEGQAWRLPFAISAALGTGLAGRPPWMLRITPTASWLQTIQGFMS
jgi:hypothetical protein